MSIYVINTKRDGKRYGVRFRVFENGDYVHKNLSPFKTQAEAKRAQFEYLQKVETATLLQSDDADVIAQIPFKEIVRLYKQYALENLAPSSVYDYYKIIDSFILPKFGDSPIASITKRALTEFQDSLSVEYSYKYKSKIRTVLSAIFTFAVNRDYVEHNPVTKIERLRNTNPSPQMQFWTKNEFDQFIAVVDNPMYKALFTFLYLSGCRKGEAFGLLKTKINYDTCMVLIDTGITKKGTLMSEKLGKKTIAKTKNRKKGEIFMPKKSLTLISEQLQESGPYVFGGDTPLAETTVARYFNKYIALAGVKKIRVHDLRHSCAALLISLSNSELNSLYAIADRLRDSVEQVLKTYGHLFPSKQAEIIRTLNELF